MESDFVGHRPDHAALDAISYKSGLGEEAAGLLLEKGTEATFSEQV